MWLYPQGGVKIGGICLKGGQKLDLVKRHIYTWIIGAFRLHRKLELSGRNDVAFELTMCQLQVGKARWTPSLSLLALQCFP